MNRLRGVATATESANRRHTRVVPAIDDAFFHQNQQVTLAHQGVVEVEFVELGLTRTVVVHVVAFAADLFEPVDKQVVERAVHHEFKGAERVGDTLKVVALAVSEVVHRVGVPLCACAMMRCLHHAVDDRVAEVHVRVRHVNLCAKYHLAFLYLA